MLGVPLFLATRCAPRLRTAGEIGVQLLGDGKALVDMVQTWNRAGSDLSVAERQSCFDFWNQYLVSVSDFEVLQIPKVHLTSHLLTHIGWFGNPRRYSTWRDESLNRVLKLACRTTHQITFYMTVLTRMREIMEDENNKAAKRPHD